MKWKCPNCGREHYITARYCYSCLHQAPKTTVVCPKCKKRSNASHDRCPHCGQSLVEQRIKGALFETDPSFRKYKGMLCRTTISLIVSMIISIISLGFIIASVLAQAPIHPYTYDLLIQVGVGVLNSIGAAILRKQAKCEIEAELNNAYKDYLLTN